MNGKFLLSDDGGRVDSRTIELNLKLIARYQEPFRYYHNVAHVCAVIEHLESLGSLNPVTRAAAWYHDAVYNPGAADNEEKSAALAVTELVGFFESAELSRIGQIIAATNDHSSASNSLDPLILAFLDADLAVLASTPPLYQFYSMGIRAEYQAFNDAIYFQGRARVLQRFLQSRRIYSSHAPNEWEKTARRNLTAELNDIKNRPS